MDYKIFTSQNGWFTLTIPKDWEEYDNEEENTYAFFNAQKWTGNFRITPFRWTELADPTEDKAAQFISDELNENNSAIKIRLGDFDCAHYKKDIQQDSEDFVIYYCT